MSLASRLDHALLLDPEVNPRRLRSQARGIAQVRSKFAQNRTMEVERVRERVAELVELRRVSTGSKMAAYAEVGRLVGKSGSWVRKLCGRQPSVALGYPAVLNIARAYTALCETLEAAAAASRERAATLRREADAALEGDCGPGGSAS